MGDATSYPLHRQLLRDARQLPGFVTGATGFDQVAMAAAFEAAREVGMQPVSGSGDETTQTGRIEVIDAAPDQVAEWEQAVDDPSR